MECVYKQVNLADTGEEVTSFDIRTRKGDVHGIFSKKRIWVHGISRNGKRPCMKGLMAILCKRFNCTDITFTPLINTNLKDKVRGTLKICKANDPTNPYGEDFEYLETVWKM